MTSTRITTTTSTITTKGFELGLRTSPLPGLQRSRSVYRLQPASELVFVGDAGTTEAGPPSRRVGFELASYYKLDDWLTIDADIAFAQARFRDGAPEGNRIPGAVEGVASVAVAVDNLGPWFGALQFRYFGPRPLIEDNSVRSKATALLNGRIGYKISPRLRVELEGFNLTNRKVSAIDYYYASRLPGEPAGGVDDLHFHPIESRSFRPVAQRELLTRSRWSPSMASQRISGNPLRRWLRNASDGNERAGVSLNCCWCSPPISFISAGTLPHVRASLIAARSAFLSSRRLDQTCASPFMCPPRAAVGSLPWSVGIVTRRRRPDISTALREELRTKRLGVQARVPSASWLHSTGQSLSTRLNASTLARARSSSRPSKPQSTPSPITSVGRSFP